MNSDVRPASVYRPLGRTFRKKAFFLHSSFSRDPDGSLAKAKSSGSTMLTGVQWGAHRRSRPRLGLYLDAG